MVMAYQIVHIAICVIWDVSRQLSTHFLGRGKDISWVDEEADVAEITTGGPRKTANLWWIWVEGKIRSCLRK